MLVGNTEVIYFIDYLGKRVHLLDMNSPGRMSLTNAIDPTFQKKFVEQEQLLKDIIEFDWLCYGTDGIIAAYSNYNFKFVNQKLPWVHQPFVEEMIKRRTKK
jgi:hypothetical protein